LLQRSKGNDLMSFYELDRPAAATTGLSARIGAFFTPVRVAARSMMRTMAYGRMMRTMYDMDDATLARIGITRAQIPAHVDLCLSGDRSF